MQEYSRDSYSANKVDLYPKWQINEYNITFMECDLPKATVLDESDVDLSQYKPNKTGHTFEGWYYDKGFTKMCPRLK